MNIWRPGQRTGTGCATRGALTPEEQERQNQLDNESGD